ncbi:MAG: phosphodiester glycosidase family protein [Clostridia bacterium]|nr:phosphodiester glycosidase family protein [Clostridia bacterium]
MLVFVMVLGVMASVPFAVLAANDYTPHDDYYKVISKDDYNLAPGIVESEIVLNNAAGSHRQVAHVVEVDLSNPYTKVIPSYKGMVPTPGNYGVQIMSQQAAFAEANGYGNVVAAMNLSLSWYDSAYYVAHPELVGEPLGYMVLDGEVYVNSQGQTAGAQTCVVINFDEKDGVARPEDMPKVEIRSTSSAITGWEEQVIPANFGFLVKDGKNQYGKDNNANNGASRSFVGIKEDGTFVMVMNDGRQAPYSIGFTSYEMAEFMLSLGCVVAVNGDGGGSSAFLSQRPGEELKVNCSPSDGAERPTTHGILVISTAPATGEFVRANITAENDYYTPGSTVKFTALGTDLVGTAADIPEDVTWQLADPSMGTIADGVFVSNGKVGTVTAQMVWNGEVVGEASVEIVIPTEFSFSQAVMTVPFDKEVTIGLNATINGGLNSVVLKPEDVTFVTTNSALGTFNGFQFTSVSQENAPADLTSTLTATLVHNTELVATASLNLGKGSEVLFDFEDASDIDGWNIADVNGNDKGFYQNLSFATSENGKVHDGIGSLRVEMNPISANNISAGGYGQSDLFLDNGVIVENAKSIGFWAYIPDEYEHCWIRVLYWYDPDGDGKFDKKNTISVINQPEVYNSWDESGWKYFSVDVSAYSKVLIPGLDCKDIIGYNASKNDANNFRFIEFMFPHTNTNDTWKTYGTINGLQTVYIDNITADFSDAVDDREAPVFGSVELAGNDIPTVLEKYVTAVTTSNLLTVSAKVAENTSKTNATGLDVSSAKAYIDGVEVPVTFANGKMTIGDVAVADGIHRVKFEICDNMGNKSVVIRLIEVKSGVDASTVEVVPADPTLDKLYGGSVYWMNVNANKIETIQSVKAVIDLNYGNHFELDHMVLADGFTATYTIDEENNTAAIVITRTGNNTQTGAVTLAALPIRVIYYDTDINIDGYTAETYWNTYEFWPYDLKVDVDMGEITYVEGYVSDVLGAFSNEEFSVDTELYCPSAGMDAAYKAEKGTAHVHTPVAVDDLAATCTKNGYTGRTYCEVCDSVVDWGTVVETTGHNYKVDVENGKLVCDCGEEFTGTGLQIVDGKAYYTANGQLVSGWISLNDEWYYFSTIDYVGPNGKKVADQGVALEFENGRVVNGAWTSDSKGMRYWYGPSYYRDSSNDTTSSEPVVIDGKTYLFNRQGYMQTGIAHNYGGAFGTHTYYDCGTDGVAKLLNGVYNNYFYKDGKQVRTYKLVEFEGNFYFINDGYKVAKNVKLYLGSNYVSGMTFADGRAIQPGYYYFDAEGKMEIPELKHGVVDGILYINDVKQTRYKLVEFEGNYYFINDGDKVATSVKLYLGANFVSGMTFADGRAIQPGTYYFDAEGKMEIPELKHGVVDGYLYINDVRQLAYQLVELDGDYYFINDGHKIAVNTKIYLSERFVEGKTFADGTAIPVGYYEFDADGKMIIE